MNPYYEHKILNSDPIALIVLLYERALTSVMEAREHLRHKRIRERSAAIMRAYAALNHLLSVLEPDAAPELCARLSGLYLYMQQRLLDANLHQTGQPLEEVLGLLTTLAEGWAGVEKQLTAERHAEAADYALSA
jgi:flagellar secretion chaperone FliS